MTPNGIDGRNRRRLAVIGLLLIAAGTLSAGLGAGVFGASRRGQPVFNGTVIRWWNEGGWKSFAVVGAIGLLAVIVGLWLAAPQLRRSDPKSRTPTIVFPPNSNGRGETTLRGPALSHGLEQDLARIPDINKASVGLFGPYPAIELRAVLDVNDNADLDQLPDRVDEVLARVHATTGIALNPIQIALRFSADNPERQLL
jgi:hypothetical protein